MNVNEIIGIAVPQITVFKDGPEITILHKDTNGETNSLLTFHVPFDPLGYEITSAVNRALGGMDWENTFDTVFTKQEYRKAVMNIPLFLIGE